MLPLYEPKSRSSKRRWLYSTIRRRWPRLLSFVLLVYLFTIYVRHKHPFTDKPHVITAASISVEDSKLATSPNGFLPLPNSTQLCSQHSFKPYPLRTQPRRIYDLIMLNNELDWLEIRLSTMSAHVSHFIVLESPITFTGLPKPLTLRENWARFEKWHAQIIYKVLESPPVNPKRTWDVEDYQRNAMLIQGVLGIEGESRAREGDVLIVADVDEIVRPASLLVLRECDIPARLTLRSRFYYYGFQWEHVGLEWAHPQATTFRGGRTILPADLRNGEGGNRVVGWWEKAELWNAGWHCSTCFQTVEEVLNKMRSFSHTSLNEERFRDRTRIVDRVRKGLDLWDRDGETYERRDGNGDVPGILKTEDARFGYLLDRDASNAGFVDYGIGEDTGE